MFSLGLYELFVAQVISCDGEGFSDSRQHQPDGLRVSGFRAPKGGFCRIVIASPVCRGDNPFPGDAS